MLYFPAPHTVTGEDILELHVHGGPAIIKAVLAAIPQTPTPSTTTTTTPNARAAIRYAEPGEFTRRAFLHNRLDLTQVEALGDTLAATTEQQRRLSVRGTARNALTERYEAWRRQLLHARAELEALIDFSEDQHFDESPAQLCASVAAQVAVLVRALRAHSVNAVRGELLRGGIGVALLGAPNAGKSSLLNRVVGREAAIVSREPGTTRDVVEVGLDLGGYFCRVGDTAGLRTGEGGVGRVEMEGMKRAKARAGESDVVLVVLSFECSEATMSEVGLYLDEEVVETAAALVREKDNVVVAINKADMAAPASHEAAIQETLAALPGLAKGKIHLISCKTAEEGTDDASTPSTARSEDPGNIQSFLSGVTQQFHDLTAAIMPTSTDGASTEDLDPSIWQASLGASERHRLLLDECISALDAFLSDVESGSGAGAAAAETGFEGDGEVDIVVAAEHLRGAADCLAKITGRGEGGDVEEVLGVVFEKFCVGK